MSTRSVLRINELLPMSVDQIDELTEKQCRALCVLFHDLADSKCKLIEEGRRDERGRIDAMVRGLER